MNYLLDTHIFLWYINGNKKLPGNFIKTIRNSENSIYISTISIWECVIKQEIGKLILEKNAATFLSKERAKHKFLSLPVVEKDIEQLQNLPYLHKDPFDRLLISQSIANNLILLTLDSEILNYGLENVNLLTNEPE